MKSCKYLFILATFLTLFVASGAFAQGLAGGICEYPLGDINQDKVVDMSDLGLMADQWLQSSGSADLDNSGNIDLIDYALLTADWGATGNCSPVVNAGIDQEITLPADANLASASVTDDGLPNPPAAVTTLWTKESGPNDVTFGDASAVGTTASFAGPGVYVLRLTANDGDMTTLDELTVTVNPAAIPNNPPEVNAGADQEITLPVSATLDGTVTDDGLPNPPAAVTQLWTKVSGPNDVTFGDANAVDTTASFAGPGVYVLRLTADDSALNAYDEVQITVDAAPVNTAPVVDAGTDASITYPTLTVSLDGTVTDDGLPNPPAAVTTLWSKVSGTGTVTFDDASAIDTIAHFPAAGGVFVLRLDANDGELSTYDEVQVTVTGTPQWGESANYYVDGITGDDTNAGTVGTAPFKTINKALTLLGNDKKVLVWGGGGGGRPATQTYSENLAFGNGAASGHQATVKRDPLSGTAVIQGDGTADVINSSKGYITIDGFKITGGLNGVQLLNATATGWIIKNCRVTGNTNHGIRFFKCAANTVNNCAIYANATGGSYAGVSAEQAGSTGHTVTQSSFYAGYYGIQAFSGSATITTVRDCIVSECSNVEFRASSGTITSPTYCDVYGTLSGVTLGANCKTGNPGYTDPANGDFTPTSTANAKPSSDGGWMGYRTSTSAL